MTDWFTVKIKYLKQNPENGSIQSKSEAYMLNALSFTEAEARLQGILEEYIPEYNLLACAKTNIQDVIVDEAFDYFYKVRVSYISADPDSGKEKKINENYTIVNSILVATSERPEVKIDWRVYTKNPDNPLIRDLIIEGLSLAKVQKEEFTSIIQNNDNDINALFINLKKFVEQK